MVCRRWASIIQLQVGRNEPSCCLLPFWVQPGAYPLDLLASYLPARRALQGDPAIALHFEQSSLSVTERRILKHSGKQVHKSDNLHQRRHFRFAAEVRKGETYFWKNECGCNFKCEARLRDFGRISGHWWKRQGVKVLSQSSLVNPGGLRAVVARRQVAKVDRTARIAAE